MARDRKRAKQRRQRTGAATAGRRGGAPEEGANGQAHSPLDRADLPGALEHAGGEVDEFDAALVRGAGGVPAVPEADVQGVGEEVEDGLEAEDALQEPAGMGGGGLGSGGGGRVAAAERPERPSGAPLRGGNRAIGFLRASWAELQRVQWPDRRQVFQATAVVIGFVAIAGAYLGIADYVAKEIVEIIL